MWWRNYSQTLPKINLNWAYLWINSLKFYTVFTVFIICQIEDYLNILKLSCKPLASISEKAFLKSKIRFGTSLPASFPAWLLKKNIYLIIFIGWLPLLISLAGCLFVRYWATRVVIVCKPDYDIISFEINLIFLIVLLFLHDQKDKTLNILRTKRAFEMKQKNIFHHFYRALSKK